MALHLPLYAAEASAVSAPGVVENSVMLADTAAHFNGPEALPRIKQLLEKGADPNQADANGNTALLLLCQSLELDYRYRTEPHYSQAVDQAIILLLEHKADPLHENKAGYNAMFHLQGKPELLQQLADKKLLPPELAVRLPQKEIAFVRYMRQRVLQAGGTTNVASRAYVARVYCTPGYDRALVLLEKYMQAEMRRHIPANGMKTTLAFLRLGKPEEAEKYINALPIWKHSEHFLEEVPAHMLQCLEELEWNVKPALLQGALDQLDSMLPRSDGEMIDCNVAPPMCLLLTMLDRQSGSTQPKQLERFSRSRDSKLAYTALCLRLDRKGLPRPEPEALAAALRVGQGGPALSTPQRRVFVCARVDEALREAEPDALTVEDVQLAAQALEEMGAAAHAALLKRLMDETGLSFTPETFARVAEEYAALHGATPQVVLARYILNHPATFPQPPEKHESN